MPDRPFWRTCALAMCLAVLSACTADNETPTVTTTEPEAQPSTQAPLQLHFPINCTLDQDCFIQQFTDMDDSPDVIDPFCGTASYDGHKGTDIRLRTLKDIDRNVEVLAAAGGRVKGVRKNQPDQVVTDAASRAAIQGVECGNGVVIDHGDNIETQYCHLKQFSSTLSSGDVVKAGDVLGYIGASGFTQFPHLHIAVRKDGDVVDPFTGHRQSQGCTLETAQTWWADPSMLTAKRDAILLGSHITGAPLQHKTLVRQPPPKASHQDAAIIGWVWYANLKAQDQVFIKLDGPNGFHAENLSDPVNRHKASWSGFVGKKRQPQIGTYKLTSYILRKGVGGSAEKISLSEKTFIVGE